MSDEPKKPAEKTFNRMVFWFGMLGMVTSGLVGNVLLRDRSIWVLLSALSPLLVIWLIGLRGIARYCDVDWRTGRQHDEEPL